MDYSYLRIVCIDCRGIQQWWDKYIPSTSHFACCSTDNLFNPIVHSISAGMVFAVTSSAEPVGLSLESVRGLDEAANTNHSISPDESGLV